MPHMNDWQHYNILFDPQFQHSLNVLSQKAKSELLNFQKKNLILNYIFIIDYYMGFSGLNMLNSLGFKHLCFLIELISLCVFSRLEIKDW